MKTITRPDSRAPACSFALLCLLLMCINASHAGEAASQDQVAGDSQAVVLAGVRNALVASAASTRVLYFAGSMPVDHTSTSPFNVEQATSPNFNNSKALENNVNWYQSLRALIALAVLSVIVIGGWCWTCIALNRTRATLVDVEREWQRRYAAIESQDQAASALAAAHAEAALTLQRDRIHSAMRYFVSEPLSALADLTATLLGATLPSAEHSLAGKIHSGVRITLRTLEDMLVPSTVESHAILLDENLIDLRELIESVVALYAPTAERKGQYLSVNIERSVAARVLADGDRLGQIVFHMLSRVVRYSGRGTIAIIVRANSLNVGSQQISISVRHVVAAESDSAGSLHEQLPQLFDTHASPGEVRADDESSLSLCQQLAQHMRGEFTSQGESDVDSRSTFSAPFAIEGKMQSSVTTAGDHRPVLDHALTQQQIATSIRPTCEPFDRTYLNALSNEGIELRTFMSGWCQSMRDDLQRMRSLRELRDIGGLRGVLHRLSGAVGLVGAHDLTEALRRASTAQPEPEADVLDLLDKRSELLMRQLDEAVNLLRSDLP